MNKAYRFINKALAALLLAALTMALAFLVMGFIYARAYPAAADIPPLFAHGHAQGLVIILCAAVGLGILACLAFLLRAAGRRADQPGFHPGWQESLPLEVYLALVGLAIMGLGLLSAAADEAAPVRDFSALLMLALPLAAFVALLLSGLLITLATRLKLGGWWRNTICYYAWRLIVRIWKWGWGLLGRIWRSFRALMANLPTIWPIGMGAGMFTLLAFGMARSPGLVWFAICLGVFWVCCLGAVQFNQLRKTAARLAAGELEAKADTTRMLPVFRRHAESLNSIGEGMTAAVNARLKSERFKAELITNVSHDLKTPLTSIVNYVDLLSKTELGSEQARAYVEVLARQAERLKKLTEDLIEASKASTGNITVERTRTDVAELLDQCAAEYTARMAAAELTPVCQAPKGLYAMADGRLLWRIFDNLLGNACKYAQPGTRVYLTGCADQGRVRIEIKNVSREVLNVSADELIERFTRGDRSRTAEGSGLGLSIAYSLAELNGGSLALTVDGDLFKATITLEGA